MKNIVIGTILSTSLLVSACSMGTSTQEQLTNNLTKVFEEEKGYRDAQNELPELEKSEQTTFNSVMEMTQEQKEEVAAKAAELTASVNDRLALLEKENDSIQAASSSLSTFDGLIKEVDEKDVKKSLTSLKDSMEERYEAHDIIYNEYQKLTSLQTELYEMLTDEETEQAQLQEQVAKVNAQNEIVQSAIDAFNESTKKVNETKTTVYDLMNEGN